MTHDSVFIQRLDFFFFSTDFLTLDSRNPKSAKNDSIILEVQVRYHKDICASITSLRHSSGWYYRTLSWWCCHLLSGFCRNATADPSQRVIFDDSSANPGTNQIECTVFFHLLSMWSPILQTISILLTFISVMLVLEKTSSLNAWHMGLNHLEDVLKSRALCNFISLRINCIMLSFISLNVFFKSFGGNLRGWFPATAMKPYVLIRYGSSKKIWISISRYFAYWHQPLHWKLVPRVAQVGSGVGFAGEWMVVPRVELWSDRYQWSTIWILWIDWNRSKIYIYILAVSWEFCRCLTSHHSNITRSYIKQPRRHQSIVSFDIFIPTKQI